MKTLVASIDYLGEDNTGRRFIEDDNSGNFSRRLEFLSIYHPINLLQR